MFIERNVLDQDKAPQFLGSFGESVLSYLKKPKIYMNI